MSLDILLEAIALTFWEMAAGFAGFALAVLVGLLVVLARARKAMPQHVEEEVDEVAEAFQWPVPKRLPAGSTRFENSDWWAA